MNFANGNASTVPVNDATFQNLSAAYNTSTTGAAIAPGSENNYIGSRSMSSGTFEVVFNVSNTAAGNEQVLLDIGADRGVSLVLDGNTLKAGVNGDATNTTGFTSKLSTGWHQAVVVVGATNPPNGSDDSFALYVDNTLVGSFDTVDIDQYAGANNWGVGGGPGAQRQGSRPTERIRILPLPTTITAISRSCGTTWPNSMPLTSIRITRRCSTPPNLSVLPC